MREDYDHELALAYIQGRLTQEEKREVFHLLMEDPGFRELMQLELRLAKMLTAVKASPPQTVAARVYFNVTASKSEAFTTDLTKAILAPIFKVSLPKLVSLCQKLR